MFVNGAMSERAGALAGVRVIEIANFIAGPLAGTLLADFGADVIKVESPPDRGDPFRVWADGLYSPHFRAYNRAKRSIALDLRAEDGARVLQRLARDADVVIHNLKPSTADALGLSYASLGAANPRVIVCAVSGFGSQGPLRDRPGFDTMGQALSGLLGLVTDPADPRVVGLATADELAGIFAAYGVMAALIQRDATGLGQQIETSLLAAAVSFVAEPLLTCLANGEVPDRFTRGSASQSFACRCADGKTVAVHLSSPEKFWVGLTEALEAPRLRVDARFASRAGRVEHYEELSRELAGLFSTRDRSSWLSRLDAHGVPCSPVHTVADVLEDEQVRVLGMIQHHPDPMGRPTVSVANPVGGAVRRSPPEPAPFLGQHTVDVLREVGMPETEIEDLMAQGVAATSSDGTSREPTSDGASPARGDQ